jgi:hypothetical protein
MWKLLELRVWWNYLSRLQRMWPVGIVGRGERIEPDADQ